MDRALQTSRNDAGGAQLTLALGRTIRQQVPLVGLAALDAAVADDAKALGCAAAGLDLGHCRLHSRATTVSGRVIPDAPVVRKPARVQVFDPS